MARPKAKSKSLDATLLEESNGEANTAPVDVMTLAEVAAFLRVKKHDILDMVTTQHLPCRQIGSEWRFLKAAVEKWLGTPPVQKGISAHLGKIKDDPYADEMLSEIYQRRKESNTTEA